VYLPGPGRWPVLVARLPYDKAGNEFFMPDVADWLVERGYAVVVQDVRGKVRSDGDFVPFVHETDDGYDTAAWIVEQSWCNGSIGAFGDSYAGYAAWAMAVGGHPAVRAIAPRVCSGDFTTTVSPGGVLQFERVAQWALETLVDEALYDGELDWTMRPLCEVVPEALGGVRIPVLDRLAGGRLPGRLPVQRLRIPALHLGGWWDISRHGQMATWNAVATRSVARQFLMIDAVDHAGLRLDAAPGSITPDPRRTPQSWALFLDEYMAETIRFFDHFVAGRSAPPAHAVRCALAWDGWSEAESWPPPETAPLTLHLATGTGREGEMSTSPSSQAGSPPLSLRHDPLDPAPSMLRPFWALAAPPDASVSLDRPDICSFRSDPRPSPLDLCGPVRLTATISSTATSTHLAASLVDVYPGGERMVIAETCTAISGPWPKRAVVELGPVGYRIRAGHSLALHLAPSLFPAYVVHPGNGTNPWTTEDFTESESQLTLGGRDGAILEVTVLAKPLAAR